MVADASTHPLGILIIYYINVLLINAINLQKNIIIIQKIQV